MDIDRTAPVIVELQATIAATPERVWAVHTDIDSWPLWNSDISRARLQGPLAEGSNFEWETHGLTVTSTIAQLQPNARIAWGGPAHGIDGIHVWIFEPVEDGTLVTTRESWAGTPVDADPEGMHAALEASLRAWLAALSSASVK